MKIKITTLLLVVFFSSLLTPSIASATTAHLGLACPASELNKKVVVKTETLICRKVNNKYRWQLLKVSNNSQKSSSNNLKSAQNNNSSIGNQANNNSNTESGTDTATVPSYSSSNNSSGVATGITSAQLVPGVGVVFNPGAKQNLDIWEDMQCPYCAYFEVTSGKDLSQIIAQGNYRVTYHLVAFLGRESFLADNAVLCAVADNKFLELKALIAQNINLGLIPENSGFMSFFLPQYELQLGLSDSAFQSCVNNGTYLTTIETATDNMQANNVTGTPAVFLNGVQLDNQTQLYKESGFKMALGLNTV